MSKGEQKIIKILQGARLNFQIEKTFNDLRQSTLRYDFYLKDLNIIIEYDGEQHFKFIKKFYNNRMDWEKAKEHDRIKNSYCLAHNIKLYRIPYWDLDKINNINDILNNKLYIVKSRWHNDDLIWRKKNVIGDL